MPNDAKPPLNVQIGVSYGGWAKPGEEGVSATVGGVPQQAKRLDFPEARPLAEWTLHDKELKFAASIVRQLLPLVAHGAAKDEDTHAMVVSMWHGAVMSYCRCFDPKGKQGSQLIVERTVRHHALGLARHQQVLDLRNTHIGHDVNGYRGIRVGAFFDPITREPSLSLPLIELMPSLDLLNNLYRLIHDALVHVASELEPLQRAMLDQLRAMSDAERQALPLLTVNYPDRSQSRASRRPRARK